MVVKYNTSALEAEITGLKYHPHLCRKLKIYKFEDMEHAFGKDSSFKLQVGENELAVSWWVSAKRTRSYPYARVYDTLGFSGKKVTIIPIYKDEGTGGERDFLQWDTISLMSLLGVYVIIGYYVDAERNPRYDDKITNQRHDITYLKQKILEILDYQSDALHWNILQTKQIEEIGKKAIESYEKISKRTGVAVHSQEGARKRFDKISKDIKTFMNISRSLAKQAQFREGSITQPSELVNGTKATITISNWLGGKYYFTVDETRIEGDKLYLIEAKHTKTSSLPALSDIKDALIKIDLFTNLNDIKIGDKIFTPIPVLKLTSENPVKLSELPQSRKKLLSTLLKEAEHNNFRILINDKYLERADIV